MKWVCNVYFLKECVGVFVDLSYEDLVDFKYKGKICICLGKYLYNLGLVVFMVVYYGEIKIK